MRVGHGGQAAALIVLVVSTSGVARAECVTLGELSFDLPKGWAPAGAAPREAPRGGLLCSWERRDGDRMTLCVEARPRPTRWSLANLRREMPGIERSVRGAPGVTGFRILESRVVDGKGFAACRIRSEMEIEGRASPPQGASKGGESIEQLQYVVSSLEWTYLLTFSWAGDGPGQEDTCHRIASSIRIEAEPAIVNETAAGALCGLLGILAGAGALSRARKMPGVKGPRDAALERSSRYHNAHAHRQDP